jgi:hypothetical protein
MHGRITSSRKSSGHRARLRTRLFEGGGKALLDYELVEYLLTLAIPRRDTKPLAKELIARFGGIGPLLSASAETLRREGSAPRRRCCSPRPRRRSKGPRRAATRSVHPRRGERARETWNDRVSVGPPVGAFPEFDGWSMGHAMPLARSEHAVAEMDGKIWVLGGYPPGRLPSNLVQVYDPATSRWSLGPRLPQPIHHIMVAAVGGKLYVIGGEIDGASTGRPARLRGEYLGARSGGRRLGARAPMPTARSGGGKAVIDGKIYVAGGRPPGGSAFEVYDPATDTWEKLPDLPTQRNHLAWSRGEREDHRRRRPLRSGRMGRADRRRRDLRSRDPPLDPRRAASGTPRRHHRRGPCRLHVRLRRRGRDGPRAGPDAHRYGYDPRADRWTGCRISPSPSTASRAAR